MIRGATRSALVIAVIAIGAGCENKKLNLRNIEAAASERFAERAGVPVTRVTCPENVRTRKGDTFDCVVVFEGGFELTLVVEQLGEGKTSWRVKHERTVFARELEPLLHKRLLDQGEQAAVQCPERIYALAPDQTITCRVSEAGGRVGSVEISYTDDGAQQVRFIPPPPPDVRKQPPEPIAPKTSPESSTR